jgi:hypothetical protein
MASGASIPFPIVLATASPPAEPIKLNTVARIMAFLGERARVPMTVAIALAASLKPLTTPKPQASAAITTTVQSELGIYHLSLLYSPMLFHLTTAKEPSQFRQ